jgi:hypothetical protein
VRQRSREAMAGVGHGVGVGGAPASRHGGEEKKQGEGIRMADGWDPRVSETRGK